MIRIFIMLIEEVNGKKRQILSGTDILVGKNVPKPRKMLVEVLR